MMEFPGHGIGLLLGYLISGRLLNWQDILFISMDCIFIIVVASIIIRHLIDHIRKPHYVLYRQED